MDKSNRFQAIPFETSLLLVLVVQLAFAGCGGKPEPTQIPITPHVESAWEKIDAVIQSSESGNLAYNAPSAMLLDETVTLKLGMSPTLSPEDLEEILTEPGSPIIATVKITPRMKAELKSSDAEAFEIQAIHADAEQLLTTTEPTLWEWKITAKEAGAHELNLTVYRLVEYEGEEYWRHQKSYSNSIRVKVTFAQRLQQIDWKWLVGLALTGLLIPAIWRWVDQRKKSGSKKKKKVA